MSIYIQWKAKGRLAFPLFFILFIFCEVIGCLLYNNWSEAWGGQVKQTRWILKGKEARVISQWVGRTNGWLTSTVQLLLVSTFEIPCILPTLKRYLCRFQYISIPLLRGNCAFQCYCCVMTYFKDICVHSIFFFNCVH